MESVISGDVKLNTKMSEEDSKIFENKTINDSTGQKKKKVPRRILHFCDGTIEEYSTDEDDENNKTDDIDAVKRSVNQLLTVDPKTMYWSSWFWYHIVLAGTSTLGVCDYLGEKLAAFFGITSPKYEYEIDYYNSVKAEEEQQKKQQDLEMGGWIEAQQSKVLKSSDNSLNPNNIITAKERY